MKRIFLAFIFLALLSQAAVDLGGEIAELALRDGRVLTRVKFVRYSENVVMARWDGGQGTLAYPNLPPAVLAAIEEGHLRPAPKPKPATPPAKPSAARPVPAADPAARPAADLQPGAQVTLRGRRQGNQLFMQVVIAANGKQYPCECLVDTGATYTTVDSTLVPLVPLGHHEFATANGQVRIPYANATVTIGGLTREVGIALSPKLQVNLLGANFFEDFLYTIDLQNAAIYLVKR